MTLITKKDITVPVTVQTRTALPPNRAFQPAVDLSLVFKGWGPFPAVRGVRNQTGAWDHAGVSRNPILYDGSMATEKLTEYTPGHSFAYEVTGFTNIVLRRLVSGSFLAGRKIGQVGNSVKLGKEMDTKPTGLSYWKRGEFLTGQRSNQLNYVPLRQNNSMRDPSIYAVLRDIALIASDNQKRSEPPINRH